VAGLLRTSAINARGILNFQVLQDMSVKIPPPPVNRDALLAFLKTLGIDAVTVDHPPLFTVEDGRAFEGLTPGAHSKNLFLKDAKGQLWLISAHADSVIDLKSLPQVIGSARLSFGSAELMTEVLGVTPGSVTALAVINDPDQRVRFVLDAALLDHAHVNFHPLTNAATTCLTRQELLRFFEAIDRTPLVVDFVQQVVVADCIIAAKAPH
jgi:Ala-tRNA(Pro) deacylase